MPSNEDKKSSARPRLLCYLYPGPFGGHNAFALQDEKGNKTHQSYHSITQEYLQKQKEDPDYIPPTQRQFREDDLPYVIDEFKHNQWDPMYHSKAMIVTDPKTLSDTLPTPVTIPLNPQEYQKAKKFMDKTQEAVKTGLQGYSIWARKSGDTQLESCASVEQHLLDDIARPTEKDTLNQSTLEQYTSPFPARVHDRAKALAITRTEPTPSKSYTPTLFKLPSIDSRPGPMLNSHRIFNPFA